MGPLLFICVWVHQISCSSGDTNFIHTAVGLEGNVTGNKTRSVDVSFTETGTEETYHKPLCNISVTTKSAQYFKYTIETWSPNFAKLSLHFIDNYTYGRTKDVILPKRWFWTYYSPDGFFPYLMWPVDFSILSFGLLDARTVPVDIYIDLKVNSPNCTLVLGEARTTYAIAKAFKQLTEDYLVDINPRSYTYSFWCYLAERPGERYSWDYFLAVYTGFPGDFEGYNCCRTDVEKTKKGDNLRITCLQHQIKKMYQCTVIPYVISLIVFAYFPVFLTKLSSTWVNIDRGLTESEEDEEWLYASRKSPLTFTVLLCGLCGLSNKYPNLVSRMRRFLFILVGPCVIYIQLLVYLKNDLINAFIRHGMPMSYLSMLGGFERSQKLFLPFLGGPYILLVVFYIGSFVFIFLPKSLDEIMDNCASIEQGNMYVHELYLLTFSDKLLEELSGVSVCKHHGYARLASRCKAGFFMVLNPHFWVHATRTQTERFVILRRIIQVRGYKKRCLMSVVVIPCLFLLYVVVCFTESLLCILYYGIPLLSFIKCVVKSYMKSIMKVMHCGHREDNQDTQRKMNTFLKLIVTLAVALLFVYFGFSFCTIFCTSLAFLALLMVFSLLAVIVYPSYSFGYLFFGFAFLYYVFKLLQGFGEIYFELLHDAVEISGNLESGVINPYLVDKILIVKTPQTEYLEKIQVNDHVIDLTDSQKQKLVAAKSEVAATESRKIRYRDNKIGIPRDLFDLLVRKYRPVHIQVISAMMRLVCILSLIIITISIVLKGSYQQKAAISEVIHVIFIVAIGALPRILELTISTRNKSVKKDIETRKMTATIEEYWRDRDFVMTLNTL